MAAAGKKTFAIAISLLIMLFYLMSQSYIARHETHAHECSTPHCEVCTQVHLAKGLFRQFGAVLAVWTVFVCVCRKKGLFAYSGLLLPSASLVGQKVRLNN